jgi:allantoinase
MAAEPPLSPARLVIRGRRVLVDGAFRPAALVIEGGRVAAVLPPDGASAADLVVEAGGRAVTPGLVDAHVHVNEPGRTEWEGYASATAAAAAGGVTTIVDMPLNGLPPATSAAGVRARRDAIEAAARVDVALWGGLVPGHAGALEELAAEGVAGIKCFLSPSGVEEFPHVGEADLDDAMPRLRALGLPLLAHAESPAVLDRHAAHDIGRSHERWMATRPPEAEAEAIALLVRLARRHGTRVHVVHVSSREGVAAIEAARADGVPVTGETCPHYLTFDGREVPDGATEYKCAPPLRSAAHREALWAGLARGALDLVATDHSPCPPGLKAREHGDFGQAWGGIASLQFLLSATWTGAHARGHGVESLLRWTSEAPARLAGLSARKGRLSPGFDADVVVWDDAAEQVLEPEMIHHRHPLTPWSGRRLRGVVHQTWVRGALAYHRGRGLAAQPHGQWLAVGPQPTSSRPEPPRVP